MSAGPDFCPSSPELCLDTPLVATQEALTPATPPFRFGQAPGRGPAASEGRKPPSRALDCVGPATHQPRNPKTLRGQGTQHCASRGHLRGKAAAQGGPQCQAKGPHQGDRTGKTIQPHRARPRKQPSSKGAACEGRGRSEGQRKTRVATRHTGGRGWCGWLATGCPVWHGADATEPQQTLGRPAGPLRY